MNASTRRTIGQLPALDAHGNCLAVIEAAAESRSKYKFEPELGAFVFHAVLPTGTSFPYAFGFIPGTLGEDGDPLDVMVLMDESPPVGAVVPCRIIAILEAEQEQHGDTVRNDRLLAVAAKTERFGECHARKDVNSTILKRIAEFFAFYHAQQGKKFTPLGWKGKKTALKAFQIGCKTAGEK